MEANLDNLLAHFCAVALAPGGTAEGVAQVNLGHPVDVVETAEANKGPTRPLFDGPVTETVVNPVLVDGPDPSRSCCLVGIRPRKPVCHHLGVADNLVEGTGLPLCESPQQKTICINFEWGVHVSP